MYRTLAPLGLLPLLLACSSYSLDGAESSMDSYGDSDYGGSAMDTGSAGDSDDGLGSEEENDFLGLRPATTNKYVFVVNTERDTVTRISVPSLEVITTSVGVRPSVVVTSSDYTRAVTFNQGSDTLSIIDAETLDVIEVDVRDNLNSMVMSPDGQWAICYHDLAADDGSDPASGSISYNEISIVDLESAVHYEAVVGTFPHDVKFTEDSSTAVVVSDDYLAVIELGGGNESAPDRIALSSDTIDPPAAEEVLLDPAGNYAFVRQYGVSELVLVDLLSRNTSGLMVGDNPTDMDLSPDGSEAIVVARGSSELWVYDMADPAATPAVIAMPTEAVFGSLLMSPDDTQGLLYSTASGEARYGVWDRANDSVEVHSLVKPVSGIGVSPVGGTALIFHSEENGDIDPDSPFYNEHALTLIDLDDFFTNPIQLAAEPTSYANAADGLTGFFIMEGSDHVGVLDYETLIHDMQSLPSAPVYLGVLPDTNTAYVSQEHDLGRISFYNPEAGLGESELQTVTGFELNSAIDQ
ncbi:MAG: DNA-binding beta-propeller fold protein YncE [Myxococcota bacterium]|jgi:DNA-binding beta-propeller fold protein YncE